MSISTRTPPITPSQWAEAQALKNDAKRKTRRVIFYSAAPLILLILLGIGAWELAGWYKVHKHEQFVASIKGDDQKMKDALAAKQITEQEFWRMRGEDRRQQFEKQMDEYFALSPADRSAWMQNFVRTTVIPMEERRKQWEAKGGPTSRPGGNGNGNNNNNNNQNNAAQRTIRYENRDPSRAAQFSQFHNAMAAAMKQMGMQPPSGRGGRGR
jgi:hypothetical protein